MRIKEIWINYQIIRRTIRKEMGGLYMLLLLIQLVILPVSFWFTQRDKATLFAVKYARLLERGELILPLLSALWIIFCLFDWTESDGRELYYLYMKRPQLVAVYYAASFHVYLLLSYLLYGRLLEGFVYEYVRISAICLLFQGLALCFAGLLRSRLATCFLLLFYTVYSYACYRYGIGFSAGYLDRMPQSMQTDYLRSAMTGVTGLIIWLMGIVLFRNGTRR